jgi:hypothetical protein
VNSILAAGGEAPWVFPTNANPLEPEFSSPTIDLKYTDYRLGGHGIWGRVYSTPAMYEWMFARTVVPEPAAMIMARILALAAIGRQRRRFKPELAPHRAPRARAARPRTGR